MPAACAITWHTRPWPRSAHALGSQQHLIPSPKAACSIVNATFGIPNFGGGPFFWINATVGSFACEARASEGGAGCHRMWGCWCCTPRRQYASSIQRVSWLCPAVVERHRVCSPHSSMATLH